MEVHIQILLLLLIIHTKSAPLSFRQKFSKKSLAPCEGGVGCGEVVNSGFGGVERLPRNVVETYVIFVPNSHSNVFNKFEIHTVYS